MDSLQRSRFAKWKGARPKAGSGSGGGVAQRAQQSAKPSGDGDLEAHSSPPHQQHQLLQRQLSLAGERDGALHQMSHLTEAVLQYTTERLMAAWQWLEEVRCGLLCLGLCFYGRASGWVMPLLLVVLGRLMCWGCARAPAHLNTSPISQPVLNTSPLADVCHHG